MINGTLHCGYCGRPMRDCTDCDARAWIMRAVCDALALLNAPPPVKPPGVGGPLVPHGPAPVKPPPVQRFVKRGFYMCCVDCGLEQSFCNCAQQPAPDAPPKDGEETSLSQREKDCKGR